MSTSRTPDVLEVSLFWWSPAWTIPGLRADAEQYRFRVTGVRSKNYYRVDLVEPLTPIPVTKKDRNVALRQQLLDGLAWQVQKGTGYETIKGMTWDKVSLPEAAA